MLWLVALASMPLAAASAPADARGVGSLALAGFLLWAIAHLREFATRRADAGRVRARGIEVASPRFTEFVLVAVVEGLGIAGAIAEGEEAPVFFFALALAFALAGIANARRHAPSDAMVYCQLAFHCLMVIPALVIECDLVLASGPGQHWPSLLRDAGRMMAVVVLGAVTLPPLFAVLVSTLARELVRPDGDRDLPGTALLGHQAACLILLLRWGLGIL